jgi:hypothetical protein
VVEPGWFNGGLPGLATLTLAIFERNTHVFNVTSRLKILCLIAVVLIPLAAFADSDAEAIQTKEGNPLKVILREHAAIYDKPDKASPSRPVKQFEFFYVLPSQKGGTEKLTNGFYRIGSAPRFSASVGWLHQDAAVEWGHHQVGGLRPPTNRDKVFFFASKEEAEKWFKGDNSARPISREPAALAGTMLFPLLNVTEFKHQGEKIDIYKLAYLHGGAKSSSAVAKSGTTTSTSLRVDLASLQRDYVLQVVFVLDTTVSMQPWIDAMKRVIATISEELGNDPQLKGRIHFGLVCFRDQLASEEDQRQMEYVAKMYCDLKTGRDHKEFRRRLADVREASIGSEDTPEDMLAGAKMAIDQSQWEKLASKHIIIISDASAHTSLNGFKNVTKMTIPGILALAQPTGSAGQFDKIQIHGLRILSADTSDHKPCKEHFDELTKGRDYQGLHYEYRGPQDADQFVKQLTARLRQLAKYTGQVASGKFEDLRNEAKKAAPGSDDNKLLGPIMEAVQAAEGNKSGATTFTEGYAVVVDRQGNKSLEPHVLVTNGRLAMFSSALDFSVKSLENAGDPGKRDVQKVVSSLQIIATQVNLGENVSPDMPLDKLFSIVLGFPVRNPIFAKTPATLAAMSSADFDGWVRQVRASQNIVQSHLNAPSIWFFLGDKQGRPQDRHAFIKVADMP